MQLEIEAKITNSTSVNKILSAECFRGDALNNLTAFRNMYAIASAINNQNAATSELQ